MQIKIDAKILIFVLIFFITKQLNLYFILMIFAFFHELSHVVVGLMLKLKPYIFEIKPVGYSVAFCCPIDDYNTKMKKGCLLDFKKIFVYIAGPSFNFCMAIFFYFKGYNTDFIYTNILLCLINLAPIYPLDGGRILKSSMSLIFGVRKSYKIVEKVSNIFIIILLITCSFLVIKVKNLGLLVIVLYLAIMKFRRVNCKNL